MNKRRRRLEIFHPPTSLLKQTFLNNVIEPCYHVFVDLGANIGDTLGHVIDAGLPFCTISGRKEFHPKFVTDHGTVRDFYTLGRWNPMSEWMYGYLCNMTAQNLYPEHFCVYSFEGNPMFTERLQRLEYRTMATIPRPVRRIHFFTESVVSHTSGPATLFLDTWGEKSNFDGSSLLNNMQRLDQVRETNQGRVKEAKVMGFTLSQILNMTVAPSSLSTIFIKMDIEGVEYHVINEAAESLCNLARQSLLVALLVERHGRMKDTEDSKRYYRETIGKLQRCGVQLTHGDGG
jgi:FkbM family methyltransferase